MPGAFHKMDAQSVGIGENAALQKRRYDGIDAVPGLFGSLPRRIADESLVGLDADEHGVALYDGALAAMIGELQGFRERIR